MKRLLIAFVPMAGLACLIGWRLNKNGEAAAAQSKVREMRTKSAPMVSVAPARSQDIDHKFEAMGSIEAPFNLKLAQQNYENLVASSRANIEDAEGRVRNADAAIANADAAIRSAQANLENARAHFRRKDDLARQGAISKQEADDAETDMSVRSS